MLPTASPHRSTATSTAAAPATSTAAALATGPLFSFGLLADVQHADKDTVVFDGRPQRYREAEGKLEQALDAFAGQRLAFLVTLGDVVDGWPGDPARSAADLRHIGQLFDTRAPGLPAFHVLGNHCLTAGRDELLKVLCMPSSYYSRPLYSVGSRGPGWRLLVLDTTEMSLHSRYPEDSCQMQQARAWAAANPGAPNKAPWNGGCTAQQLEWLQQQLADAAAVQEQLIIACHHPVAPGSAPADYLAWDNHKLMDVIAQQPGVVRCVLSGHFHPGGYVQRDGVHYVTFEGVLEAPAASNAYGVVEVHPDRLVILGSGVARCRELLLS